MEESLSIEETNKLRISLGLKPLKVDTDPRPSGDLTGEETFDNSVEGHERRAVANWKKNEAEVNKEAARKAKLDGIKKARDVAKRFAQLDGKGLGEAGEDEEDTTTWVRKMKKRQKKLVEKMGKEREEELERAAREHKEYTADDLAGVRVGHDLEELHEGEEGTILTLKDSTIEENEEEGDELISTDLAERERLHERLELKKKKPVYNAYDEDVPGENGILAQYDEEIDGKKKKRFVLDGSGNSADINAHREDVVEKLKAKSIIINLDMPKPEVTSDYALSMKIRKPKKKKSKSTRQKSENDNDSFLAPPPAESGDPEPDSNSMEVDSVPAAAPKPKRTYKETSFVDDEDLQDSLALQRRAALKKRKLPKPDAFARQLLEESAAAAAEAETEAETAMVEDDEEGPGLIIDETTEFVANLRAVVIPERKKIKTEATRVTSMAEDMEEAEDHEAEDMEVDQDDQDDQSGHKSTTPVPSTKPPSGAPEFSSTGLEEESTMNRGVGATLAMLHQRGLLKRDEEAENKVQLLRDRENFNVQKRLREVEAEEKAKSQRLRDRQSGKFDRMSAREREEHARWENKQRDLQEARDLQQRFKDYRPDVNLEYKDEFGRDMTAKEAFKNLSHQFHGKGSGKAKTEKRLKKIEDEKKREATSSLNTNSASAVQAAAKKGKQAGVRLM